MTLKVTTVRIKPDTLEGVKRLAKELNMERSELLREALSLGLQELRIRLALGEYAKGKISIGKAAETAGMGIRELLREAKKRDIQIRYGEERFEEELKELKLA